MSAPRDPTPAGAHPYLSLEQHRRFMALAIEAAWSARGKRNHPFGAVLVDRAGRLLLTAENTVVTDHDSTAHAERNLLSRASQRFAKDALAAATMYTSAEPCPMCTGALYWVGLGHVVYGLSAARLAVVAHGKGAQPSLDIGCRELLARGRRHVSVLGPVLEDEAQRAHEGFWGG